MRIRLVFDDWRDKNHKSIYSTEKGLELSTGNFHSGTTFDAEIHCPYDEEYLQDVLKEGFVPYFYVLPAGKHAGSKPSPDAVSLIDDKGLSHGVAMFVMKVADDGFKHAPENEDEDVYDPCVCYVRNGINHYWDYANNRNESGEALRTAVAALEECDGATYTRILGEVSLTEESVFKTAREESEMAIRIMQSIEKTPVTGTA